MNTVQQFYDGYGENEWTRLERHRMEFALTMRLMEEHLPAAPARVLDIGGGPGRYSIALAKQGYEVTLLDLSAELLAIARKRAAEAGVTLAGVIHGNALDLAPLPDAAFDAVLLMGPLYHLLKVEERQQAVREARRVLKPGGILVASFISRYAWVLEAAFYEPDWLLKFPEQKETMLQTGQNQPESGFTDAYFAHPAEVRPLLEGEGFTTLDLIASEGITGMIDEKMNALTGEVWAAWVNLNYRLGKDPSVHGASYHLAWAGRKG
ncbi:MAG TPA: class I SAM-dependent methyltransferase [Symbiobacteriaceae bacterium]|jgi:ubiquinone/menaquinone biosynthesis C-methylase UbiE|nr:class I SAM-dependent methyltransferase [Symbiobacteriaceae bacterium]